MTIPKKQPKKVLEKFQEEGKDPEDLIMTFSCQNCGHLCCSDEAIEQLNIPPYTAAFINKYKPMGMTVVDMVKQGILTAHVNQQTGLVYIRPNIENVFCPFLRIDWSKAQTMLVSDNFDKYFFLTTSVATVQTQQTASFIYPLPSMFKIFYDDNEDQKIPMNMVYLAFKQVLEKYVGTYLSVSCGIYPARPPVCRLFPLGRLLDNTDSHSPSYKVAIAANPCPASAFTGKKQTAKAYIEEQNVQHVNIMYKRMISDWAEKSQWVIKALNTQKITYNQIITSKLYTEPEFIPDEQEFYLYLNDSLFSFVKTMVKIAKDYLASLESTEELENELPSD